MRRETQIPHFQVLSQSGTVWAGLTFQLHHPWGVEQPILFNTRLPEYKFVNRTKAERVTQSIQKGFEGRKLITVHFPD